MRNIQNVYYLIKVLRIDESKQIVKYKNKDYRVDLKRPAYRIGNDTLYFLDMDKGSQLTFNKIKAQANPDDLDIIVGQKIVKELTKGVIDNRKEYLMYFFIGLIIGALLVGFVMSMVYQNKIQEILINNPMNNEPTEIIPLNLTKTMRLMFK